MSDFRKIRRRASTNKPLTLKEQKRKDFRAVSGLRKPGVPTWPPRRLRGEHPVRKLRVRILGLTAVPGATFGPGRAGVLSRLFFAPEPERPAAMKESLYLSR